MDQPIRPIEATKQACGPKIAELVKKQYHKPLLVKYGSAEPAQWAAAKPRGFGPGKRLGYQMLSELATSAVSTTSAGASASETWTDKPLRDLTILIADSNPERRELLASRLEGEGYLLLEASDGQDAVDIAYNHPLDLIILDFDLPRRDGVSVCRALKAESPTAFIPVVMLAGSESIGKRLGAFQVGAYGLFNLPQDLPDLLPRIEAMARLKRMADEFEAAESVAMSFALGINANDSYTAGHSQRVADASTSLAAHVLHLTETAIRLGHCAGLRRDQLQLLRRAALVHDLGKIGIPTEVIRKKGKLSNTERWLVELHPVIGERICRPLKSFSAALPIIRHHHEKLDGSGYPDGLKGLQIPVLIRIVSIADVYDALTSGRSYRPSLPHEQALALLQEEAEKGWWDKDLVQEFSAIAPAPVPSP